MGGIISTVLAHLLAPVWAPAAARLSVARRTTAPGVALTFDDGPHPEGTPAVLEILARAGARATFFVVGEQVRRRPALLEEIVAGGHLVALHADRHRLQPRLTATQLGEDLARGAAAIGEALGTAPRLHRPPYGVYSPAGLRAAREAGLWPLLWSRWGKDWRKHITPGRIATLALRQIGEGDVILLHDSDFYSAEGSHRRTAVALELITAELNRRKLGTVLPV